MSALGWCGVLSGRRRICGLQRRAPEGTLKGVEELVIHREEVVALLFNVSDIALTLTKIERLLGGDDAEEEADEG